MIDTGSHSFFHSSCRITRRLLAVPPFIPNSSSQQYQFPACFFANICISYVLASFICLQNIRAPRNATVMLVEVDETLI
ncbi:unnamed protein product [Litomosoides sigmodontis]|uniref:Uncharacterized protein n=1 Tax=Litomosoides sigmodontis TaxID=42156 RepID=A0A3P6SHJ8_LITSI|nr:unnamed protein product [Litomosoides sigmodontis]